MGVFRRIWHRFRSAITGRFVSRSYANQNPDTTIRESAAQMAERLKREEL